MMYRAVCQPDGARGGGPLSACQQILIFHPAGVVGVLYMSVCEVGGGVRACFHTRRTFFVVESIVKQVRVTSHLVFLHNMNVHAVSMCVYV